MVRWMHSTGEKVSVAALLVLEEYKRIAAAITQGRCHAKPYENEDEELLKENFWKKKDFWKK